MLNTKHVTTNRVFGKIRDFKREGERLKNINEEVK
jgi:hypothetical protein